MAREYYGYYMWPPTTVSEEKALAPSGLDALVFDWRKDTAELTIPLAVFGTEARVTKFGGVFFHLPKSPTLVADRLNVTKKEDSADKARQSVEKEHRATHRLCEYFTVFDACVNLHRLSPSFQSLGPEQLFLRSFTDKGPSGFGPLNPFASPEGILLVKPDVLWPTFPDRHLSHKQLKDAGGAFEDLVSKADKETHIDLISLVAQYQAGCQGYRRLDWIACIIASFAVAEALAQECWRRHATGKALTELEGPLSGNAKKLVAQWQSHLTKHKRWVPNVADLLEAAHQTSQISSDTYDDLEAARSARNGWMHSQIHPSLDSARHAIHGTAGMLKDCCVVHLRRPGGFQYGKLRFT